MNLKKLVTIILCAIILNIEVATSDNDDDLEDFDFMGMSNEDPHNIYEDASDINLMESNWVSSAEEFNSNHETLFDLKEKAIRTALAKALINKSLRQKFVEVIPILRVLSTQQRLALSAIISAQVSAKPGAELKLNQVKSMFGDSEKLIIPIILDIANLVKTASKNSLNFFYEQYSQPQPKASRRTFEVSLGDTDKKRKEKIDAMTINDQLYRIREGRKVKDITESRTVTDRTRSKRSASCGNRCSTPLERTHDTPVTLQQQLSTTKIPNSERKSFHEVRLNGSNFIIGNEKQDPYQESKTTKLSEAEENYYVEVENLALIDINGTTSKPLGNISNDNLLEELPMPEGLIGSRRRAVPNKAVNILRKGPRAPPRLRTSSSHKCERFTASMCIKSDDYPLELIMGSIRRHKNAMSALLAEFRDKAAELEYEEYLEEVEQVQKRRGDGENEVTPGGMCQSIVRYARPQKARSASGEWKYIVNTGQHTQTLRLEKCSHPQGSCSYLSENFRSRCVQVYNYHRLLSWDKARGLHVEIFKVPICCSCHVDGYKESFPPIAGIYSGKIKDYTTLYRPNPQSYAVEESEYEEEDLDDGDDSIAFQYIKGFKKSKPVKYDISEMPAATGSIKTVYEGKKHNGAFQSMGSYLGPPRGLESQFNFKRSPNLSPNVGGFLGNMNRQHHYKNVYESDDRVDQESAGSEVQKGVTVHPPTDKSTVQIKRKRVSSSIAATSKPLLVSSSSPNANRTTFRSKNVHNAKLPNTKTDLNKRVNYNYHPIIDFFEERNIPASIGKKQKRGGISTTKNRQSVLIDTEDSWRPIVMEE